jgi:hypothetical protein
MRGLQMVPVLQSKTENYFGIANCYNQCVEPDHWIRRRLRMAYWHQWRLVRTRIGKLISLGVAIESAVACGRTSKGPCSSSKTPGIQQTLSNDFLKAEGLFSLRQRWRAAEWQFGHRVLCPSAWQCYISFPRNKAESIIRAYILRRL